MECRRSIQKHTKLLHSVKKVACVVSHICKFDRGVGAIPHESAAHSCLGLVHIPTLRKSTTSVWRLSYEMSPYMASPSQFDTKRLLSTGRVANVSSPKLQKVKSTCCAVHGSKGTSSQLRSRRISRSLELRKSSTPEFARHSMPRSPVMWRW